MGLIVVAMKQYIRKKLLECPCKCRNTPPDAPETPPDAPEIPPDAPENPPDAPENPPDAPENPPYENILEHLHTPPQAASTPTSNLSPLETTLTIDNSTTSSDTLIESPVSFEQDSKRPGNYSSYFNVTDI